MVFLVFYKMHITIDAPAFTETVNRGTISTSTTLIIYLPETYSSLHFVSFIYPKHTLAFVSYILSPGTSSSPRITDETSLRSVDVKVNKKRAYTL